jgi:hypothetical protein
MWPDVRLVATLLMIDKVQLCIFSISGQFGDKMDCVWHVPDPLILALGEHVPVVQVVDGPVQNLCIHNQKINLLLLMGCVDVTIFKINAELWPREPTRKKSCLNSTLTKARMRRNELLNNSDALPRNMSTSRPVLCVNQRIGTCARANTSGLLLRGTVSRGVNACPECAADRHDQIVLQIDRDLYING